MCRHSLDKRPALCYTGGKFGGTSTGGSAAKILTKEGSDVERRRRIVGIVMLVFLLLALALSLDYILVNEEHECTGAGCEICAVLQTAEETLRAPAARAALSAVAAAAAVVLLAAVIVPGAPRAAASPVSRCDVLIA